jgi:hypothetical protein
VTNIIDKDNNISQKMEEEIINLLNTILEQNYIEHNGPWHKQNNGLALGATSALLSETFMQHLKHTITVDLLKKFQITDYDRYVNDILILYKACTTNINNTLFEFNKVHPRIKFTIEEEFDKIKYLDISITKAHNELQLGTYRKTT